MNLKFSGQKEIKVRPGLTIVRCETLGKFFVKETLDPVETLPPSMQAEIEPFLATSNKRRRAE